MEDETSARTKVQLTSMKLAVLTVQLLFPNVAVQLNLFLMKIISNLFNELRTLFYFVFF